MTIQEFNIMNPDMKNLVCLNQQQVSKALGLSPSTLYNWRKEKINLEYIQVGKGIRNRVLYPKTKVIEFLNDTIKVV